MDSYLLSLRIFGEMTTLHMGSHLWVVINSDRVASEIISKRATITSERAHMPISSDLISNGKRSVLQRSATWSEGRRLMRPLLTGPLAKTFVKWQDLESAQLLLSCLQSPEKWYLHHSRYATAATYGVVAGHRLNKSEEELAEYRKVTKEFLASLFNTTVDFFPILSRIPRPLQLWRQQWEAVGLSHRRIFKKCWGPIKEKVEEGLAGDSWVRDVLLKSDKGREEEALYLTNSVISAGGDNIRMTLNTFAMVSIHYPQAFQKCRQEIDEVCGGRGVRLRLPGLEDISSMPCLCAFIKELLRWRPVVPLIPPHQLTEELKYAGFVFSVQTNFVINTVAICADCEQPEKFLPERWLDGSGNEAILTHRFWGFGGGRRVCIGYKAAQPALFLALSRLICCFDFELNGNYDSKRLNHGSTTEPFPVRVSKRSSTHEHLIWKEGAARGLC
ncbi:cytochrome P450 [Mollisia scopiformis]|uniref:Cytochrome P450 n=1 Tax=Mollisia scopiformis TaxID=149040 RepID=A0A194XAB2_MOLSC|nr:cytochrome P450 [Mollisia scopiformis]KUJ17079.1 cytochrome P450 [Mollisia scopiformis]